MATELAELKPHPTHSSPDSDPGWGRGRALVILALFLPLLNFALYAFGILVPGRAVFAAISGGRLLETSLAAGAPELLAQQFVALLHIQIAAAMVAALIALYRYFRVPGDERHQNLKHTRALLRDHVVFLLAALLLCFWPQLIIETDGTAGSGVRTIVAFLIVSLGWTVILPQALGMAMWPMRYETFYKKMSDGTWQR